jgi:hypothetical protein
MDGDFIHHKVTYLLRLCDQDHDDVLEASDFETWVDRLAALRGWEPGSAGYAALELLFVHGAFGDMVGAAGRADGRMDLDTMARQLLAMVQAHAPEVSRWAAALFELLDADGVGLIGREEYRDLLASLCVDRASADASFARIAAAYGTRLSSEDFSELYVGFFLDADPDAPASGFWGFVAAPHGSPDATPPRMLDWRA